MTRDTTHQPGQRRHPHVDDAGHRQMLEAWAESEADRYRTLLLRWALDRTGPARASEPKPVEGPCRYRTTITLYSDSHDELLDTVAEVSAQVSAEESIPFGLSGPGWELRTDEWGVARD